MKKLFFLILLTGLTYAANGQRLFYNYKHSTTNDIIFKFQFDKPGTVYCIEDMEIQKKIPISGTKFFELKLDNRTWGHYIDYERNCIILVFDLPPADGKPKVMDVERFQQLIDRERQNEAKSS